jgi:hypothetical protein
MGWFERHRLKQEENFTEQDFRHKYPTMHPDSAAALAEMNRIIKENQEKRQKERDNDHLQD